MNFEAKKGINKIEYTYTKNNSYLTVKNCPYPNRPDFGPTIYSHQLDKEDDCSAKGCGCLWEEKEFALLIAGGWEMLEMLKEASKALKHVGDFAPPIVSKIDALIERVTNIKEI